MTFPAFPPALAGVAKPAPYVGHVATGVILPTLQYSGWLQMNSRTPHVARDDITQLKVAFPSFYVNGASGEASVGGNVTFTASIEYPAGTFTQVKWSTASSIVQAANSYSLSDWVTVTIPKGKVFWVRNFAVTAAAGGLPYATIIAYGSWTGTISNGSGGSGDIMNVTALSNCLIRCGMEISGTGVTAGTIVTAFITGRGGKGTYRVSNSMASTGSITISGSATASNLLPGLGAQAASSGLSDATMSGTLGNDQVCIPPCLIVGYTRRPSFTILGDSTFHANGYEWQDWSCDVGLAARSIGPHFGYANYSNPSETAESFADPAKSANRVAMGQYGSHTLDGLGLNDLGSRTLDEIKTDKQTIAGYFPGKIICNSTVPPYAPTTSDDYATYGNQTPGTNATYGHNVYNTAIRARQPGVSHVFDFGAVCEGVIGGGRWAVDYGYPTPDGIHGTPYMNTAVAASGVFNPAHISRLSY